MIRRTFLKLAAAAAVAGAEPAPAPSTQPIRCALLGIDHAHALDVLGVLRALPEYEVVGVCEPDSSVRAAFEPHPDLAGIRWLTPDELLEDPTLHMVAVESGVPRLLNLAHTVVDAGKHLHLDKPAGTSLAEFQALLDDAARKNLLVQMGYMFRYNPGFDLIRKAVAEGWLGDVYSIQTSMCTDLGPEKRARMLFHPGGIMLELGCHLIDMIVLLKGEPPRVTPFLRHDGRFDDRFADNTLAVLEYDWGFATVEVAAMEPHAFAGRRFRLVGPNGSLTLNPLEPPRARLALKEGRGTYAKGSHDIELPDLERHVLDFQDLARCIRGEAHFAYPKTHDLAVQRTVLRACGEDIAPSPK